MKTSCKRLSIRFLEVNNFPRNYLQYFAKEVEQFMKEFSCEQKKNIQYNLWNKILTVHLKYATLLPLQHQSQDLSLLLLQGSVCLTLLSLNLLILNELLLSFSSFPFIFLFLRVFWSKFAILFEVFLKKTPTTSQLNLQFCFYPQCYFHLASYVLMSLQILPLFFFLMSWAFFFSFSMSDCLFEYLLRFYVHFLQISLLGLQKVAATFDFSSCFWLIHLFMKVIKWSPLVVTANSSQLFRLSAVFPTSRCTFIYTFARHFSNRKNVLFLIPRHDRPKEGGKQIHLQFV